MVKNLKNPLIKLMSLEKRIENFIVQKNVEMLLKIKKSNVLAHFVIKKYEKNLEK